MLEQQTGGDMMTTADGTKIDSFTNSYGYSLTHIRPYCSSCLDLIFTNQPNLVIEGGAHPSLLPNCHHQIVFAKLNLKIEYPTLHEPLICDYKNVNVHLINRAIESFNWAKLFEGENVHTQVHLFNKILLNIIHNLVPNRIIICNDKHPPWFNDKIR